METNKKIKDSIILKVISSIFSLITTALGAIPLAFKVILKKLISSLFLSLILFMVFHINFIQTLLSILIIFILINLVLDFKLLSESFINQYDSIYGNFKFSFIINKYLKGKEKYKVSPIIIKNKEKYRVIEYGTYSFNPTNESKITGFLAISEEGWILQEKEIINDVINLYRMWRYIYFNQILGKYLKKNHKPLIKFWIKFQNRLKLEIEKRKNDNYKKFDNINNKQILAILEDLDNQVLEQYPFVIEKLQICLEIFNNIYNIFLRPSDKFYSYIYAQIERIANITQEENKIWTKRLRTWESLYKYNLIKVGKMPEPNFKEISKGISIDAIKYGKR